MHGLFMRDRMTALFRNILRVGCCRSIVTSQLSFISLAHQKASTPRHLFQGVSDDCNISNVESGHHANSQKATLKPEESVNSVILRGDVARISRSKKSDDIYSIRLKVKFELPDLATERGSPSPPKQRTYTVTLDDFDQHENKTAFPAIEIGDNITVYSYFTNKREIPGMFLRGYRIEKHELK